MVSLQEWERQIEKLISSKPKEDATRLKKAVDFAKMAHDGDFRKSTHEPYIVHPLEVCLVASTVTDDVDVLIAALFHDVVEDTDHTLEEIREGFGDRVAGFVKDESEDKMQNIPKAMSWMIRKEKFLEHLQKAPIESKTICMSDKISNLRSTYEMHEDKGDKMWEAFNQKDPRRHAWYYRSIAETIIDDFEDTNAFKEYCELYEKIFGNKIKVYVAKNGGVTMTINEMYTDDKTVQVSVSGRITSSNAEDFFNGAKEIIADNPGKEMVYDLDNLEMISSAGLRVFLRLKKEKINFKIINASTEVFEVFEMTGFNQMFDIKKAYKKMDLTGCKVIGEGAKGIVYRIDDETIVKVYKDNDVLDEIIKERECAKKALVMGIPTAISFDIVRVGEKLGSVFELVDANSLIKTLIAQPDKKDELMQEYVDLLKIIHGLEDTGEHGIAFPKIKDEIITWAEFTKDHFDAPVYEKIMEFADNVPDVNTVLHGDCHPDNIMCTKDEMLIIDMDTLCVGDSIIDVSIVYTALVGFKTVDKDNAFIPLSLEESSELWNIFIHKYYEGKTEEEIKNLEDWCKKFCYLRLFRRGIRKESNPEFAQNAKKELLKLFS